MERADYLHYEWEQILHSLKLLNSFKKRSSGVLVGKCIFHLEKTASLHLWKSKRFKCHGCGAEGDIVDFVIGRFYKFGHNTRNEERTLKDLEDFFKNIPQFVSKDQMRFLF